MITFLLVMIVALAALNVYQHQQSACLACGRQAREHCWYHGVEELSNSCSKYSTRRHERCTKDHCVRGAKLGARLPEGR